MDEHADLPPPVELEAPEALTSQEGAGAESSGSTLPRHACAGSDEP